MTTNRPPHHPPAPITARLSFWLGLFLFAFYLLGFSGNLQTVDELALFTAGNNLIQQSRIDINQLLWANDANEVGAWGEDGRLYARETPVVSFLAAPLIWLGRVIPGLNAVHLGLLAPPMITALSAGLLLNWLIGLGFSRRMALLLALGCGLTAGIWPYARTFNQWPVVALAVLLIVWAANRRWPISLTGKTRAILTVFFFLGLGSLILWGALNFSPNVIWFTPTLNPPGIQIHLLLPPLIVLIFAGVSLISCYQAHQGQTCGQMSPRLAVALTLFLTWQMMLGAAHLALKDDQAQADLPLLETLAGSAQPGDALLVSIPSQADAQRFLTWLMAYQDHPLPAYVWVEDAPKAVEIEAQERIWQDLTQNVERVWLFERQLNYTDPLRPTVGRFNRDAFYIQETWFDQGGKMTLYALPQGEVDSVPLNIPFAGDLTLVDFAIFNHRLPPGEVLKLRLTWRAGPMTDLPPGPTMAFAQLLDEVSPERVASQQDRLLIDRQALHQSPLLPGETVTQGYGLPLSADLSPGRYVLIVGLYDLAANRRLTRADGSPDDFLYLTTVEITAP